MQRRVSIAVLGLACAMAHGQQTPDLQRTLEKLGEAAVQMEHSLPSFTCAEDVVSQELRDGKVRRSVLFTAALREQQQPDGKMAETFQINQVDGRPFSVGTVDTPVVITGGFDTALRYFLPERQACYDFQLAPGRIDFTSAPTGPAQRCEAGLVGFARLDAQNNVSYVERRVPAKWAAPRRLATYAAVTFSPVTLGGKTFLLSSHMLAEMPQGRSIGRFEATYRDCRLFKATVTIDAAGPLTDGHAASK